jgi:hypothetical protein
MVSPEPPTPHGDVAMTAVPAPRSDECAARTNENECAARTNERDARTNQRDALRTPPGGTLDAAGVEPPKTVPRAHACCCSENEAVTVVSVLFRS